MAHTLVIVESPAKAKTIGKYLGQGYQVESSVGHVRDLPKSNRDAVDIEAGFVPHYIVTPGKETVIAKLRRAAKKADQVLLASDPDREGEAIAWHIANLLKDSNRNIKRIVFHEITADAVHQALAHPRDIDMHLKEAQEARRVLDRLVGYDLSGLIWKKVRYGLSAGRVQSPALRILMEREREIRAFEPEPYHVITAHTNTRAGDSLALTCTETPADPTEAARIESQGKKGTWSVAAVRETEQQRKPLPPFTTSTLQQTASTRLGFSPSRTMGAAQKLYEAGAITYMRTDSTQLSSQAQRQLVAHVKKQYGESYAAPRQYNTKSKAAQEAHEAIRPTNVNTETAGSSADQQALYQLIRTRALTSQMAPARLRRTRITARCETAHAQPIPEFATRGARLIFDGWLRADPAARGEDTEVPAVTAEEPLTLKEIEVTRKETQPPNRYTEAGLIKELEKRGIGRPSTYASIMKTITERGYAVKEGRTLIPSDTGDVVSSFLETHFPTYISDTFTSEMESKLDQIADGERDYTSTLREFYTPFQAALAAKADIPKLTDLGPGPAEFPCPQCDAPMNRKLGRAGTFLSCSRFPECDGARRLDGTTLQQDAPLGTHPETGEPIYLKEGRYGAYVQQGEDPKKGQKKKPRRAAVPSDADTTRITLADALTYLALPRELGTHPDTGEPVIAGTGRFGPYVVHAGDYRSLKEPDNPYHISFERALELLREPKKLRKGETLVKQVGIHPQTRKLINVYESKSGRYLKKGFKRISLPPDTDLSQFGVEDAVALLKAT